MATPTPSTNQFLALSAELETLQRDTSTHFSSEPGRENSARFWIARMKLQKRLIIDYYKDIQVLQFSKKRSYLVTRNEDGSLDLTAVGLGFPEIPMEPGDTSLCRAISKTEKL